MWKTYLLRIRVLALSLLACRQHGCKLNLPDGMYLSVVSFMDLNTFRTLRSRGAYGAPETSISMRYCHDHELNY